ncbi:MAG: DUF2062 domain-containing protein [Deferribacteres bacterium]|nr:DUF2062 domain-containing protein [Deferribacteres bacterium]
MSISGKYVPGILRMAYFRDKFRSIFQVQETPHRIALAFAIGVFWGFSPLLGLHTIGAFITAWLLGLNKLVTIVGVWIGNPWTLVPVYTFCLWLGAKMVGIKQIIPEINWNELSVTHMISELGYLLKPFFIGSMTVSIVFGLASYFIIHFLATRYKKTQDAA